MSGATALLLLLGLLQAQPSGDPGARPGNVNLIGARLSGNTVQLGEVFELTITARLPGGHVVFFPDTLEIREGVESAGEARGTLRPIEGDSMELVVTYPLRAFAIGELRLPQADLFLQRAETERPGGQPVQIGDFDDLSLGTPGSYTRRPIVAGSVEVEPVLPLARPEGGLQPRPLADVVGSNWGIPIYILLGLTGLVLLIAFTLAFIWGLRRVRAWPPRTPMVKPIVERPMTPRERALRELDVIAAEGLHRDGRMDEFYTRSTGAARRYVEELHPALGPWLTDRELLRRLASANSANGVHSFRSVLQHAEVVRFGHHIPGPDDAEADLRSLREWVAQYPPEGQRLGQETPPQADGGSSASPDGDEATLADRATPAAGRLAAGDGAGASAEGATEHSAFMRPPPPDQEASGVAPGPNGNSEAQEERAS